MKNELTKREIEITELIAWGASTKDVANRLFLSVRTVENHIRNIHEKLGLQKSNELSAWWFCKKFGIDPDLSPLKHILVVFFIGLVIMAELTDTQMYRFRSKARTEVRTGRRISKGEHDYLIEI